MRYLILSLLFIGASFPAYSKTLDYEQAMDQGIKNSPITNLVKKNRLEVIGPKLDDTKLTNPELEYEYNIDNQVHEVSLSQPLRVSDITLSRKSYKDILKELNSFEKKLDFLRIYHQLSISYYDLYIVQERTKYKKEHLNFLNKVSNTVHKSINHNNLSAAEIFAFDADIDTTKTEISQLKEDFYREQISFSQTLNLANSDLSLKKPPMIRVPVSLENILSKIEDYPSQRKFLLLEHKQAQQELSILNQDRNAPIISPKLIYGYDNQAKKDDFKVGVTLSIPLWNRQSGTHSALKANEKYTKSRLDSLDNVTLEEVVRRAYQKLSTQANAANKYSKSILPAYQKSIKRIETSFQNGQVTIFDVWQIREKYINAQEQYLNTLKSALESKIELETIIGTRLEDIL